MKNDSMKNDAVKQMAKVWADAGGDDSWDVPTRAELKLAVAEELRKRNADVLSAVNRERNRCYDITRHARIRADHYPSREMMFDDITRGIISGQSIAAHRAAHAADTAICLAGKETKKATSDKKDEEAAETARKEERARCAQIVQSALSEAPYLLTVAKIDRVMKEIYGD